MLYEIDTSKPVKLNWAARGSERIIQNVFNLINTWRYEVAYNRTMGMDPRILDCAASKAIPAYIADVYRVINDYEPRAVLKEFIITGVDKEGNMKYRAVIEI